MLLTQPTALENDHVRLEPLSTDHIADLSEAAVGLAIIIAIFRHGQTVNLKNINLLKG